MVKLSVLLPDGHEMIVALRRSHWLIAAPAVILGRPYSFTATAITKCSLRSMPAKEFVRLLKRDIRFSWHINRILSREIASKLHQTVSMGCLTARVRLEEFLGALIAEHGDRDTGKPLLLSLPISHLDLARIIAVTPEHLCRMLRDMEQEGIIKRDKGMLAVTNSTGFVQANPL